MWVNLRHAAGALAFSALASSASAAVIADFRADFQPGTPKAGWSYLWNAQGPVGHATNYVPLVPGSQFLPTYETENGPPPHSAPGFNLSISSTTIFPGQGSTQSADGLEYSAIVGYTISAADIVAGDGREAWLDTYRFTLPYSQESDGINARIYINDTLLIAMPLPSGLDFDSASSYGAYPVPLGNLNPGDTVYIAIGAGSIDTADALDLSFTISLVPEPATLSMLGLMGVGLLSRRIRRA